MDEFSVVAGRGRLLSWMRTRADLVSALSDVVIGRSPTVALSTLANALDTDFSTQFGDQSWAAAQALRSLDMGLGWEPALKAADLNPERYRDAARHLAREALDAEQAATWSPALIEALSILAGLDKFNEAHQAAQLLRRVPLSPLVTSLTESRRPWKPVETASATDLPPTVLVRFTLDGEPVSWPMALHAGRAYRLGAVVRVDSWPKHADHLLINLEGAIPPSVIERPEIRISAGTDAGEGYIVPKVEIEPRSTVSLAPAVIFVGPGDYRRPANVVGQRTLRIATFESTLLGSGQPMVAQRIIELLAELDAKIPTLPPQDRRDLIHLLDATSRFAAVANEREDLMGLSEAQFQAKLKEALTLDRFIGRRLQEAPKLGRGTTDLMLGRIVDELKVSHEPISIDDADKFVRQPTQYSSAGDCPVSMLTILDDAPKSHPPGIQSNYMRWAYPTLYGRERPLVPSMVAAVIIPVGFRIPSLWSKLPPAHVDHGA